LSNKKQTQLPQPPTEKSSLGMNPKNGAKSKFVSGRLVWLDVN